MDQSILQCFCPLWKEMARKPLKDVAEIFFSRLYVIDTTCFDECFLLQLIKESIISYKSLLLF